MRFFLSAPTDPKGNNRHGYALQDMGHDIYCFDHRKICKEHGEVAMNHLLIEKVKRYNPDLFLQIAHGPSVQTLKTIKNLNYFSVGWWFDHRVKFPNWIIEYADVMDYFITVVKSWEQYADNIIFMPQGFSAFEHSIVKTSYTNDVVFIGNPGGGRYRRKVLEQLLPKLIKAKVKLKVYGGPSGWEKFPSYTGIKVEGKEFSKIVNSSRINLGLFPFDNMDRPAGYQSNRIHQTIGAGGFFLTHETEDMELLYDPGVEVATYKQTDPYDIDDLYNKILYYLGPGKKERELIRKAGNKRALMEHTYCIRFNEIIQLMIDNTQ